VGWLHKDLTASNVAFFPKKHVPQSHCIREPLLIGFSHSRPDDPLGFFEGLTKPSVKDYQHPTYLRNGRGYKPEFDYYSFGIILIEIGCWTPIGKITEKYTGTYEERRQKLISDRAPGLARYMGRDYVEAVKFCLKGNGSEQHVKAQGGTNCR
jgi:hypothetical protein